MNREEQVFKGPSQQFHQINTKLLAVGHVTAIDFSSNVLFMDIHTPTFLQYTQFSHTQIILTNPSSTFRAHAIHGCATLSTVYLPSSDIFTLHLAWFIIKREDLVSFFL